MYVEGKHVYKGSSKTHVSAVQRAAQIETTRGGRRRVAVSLAALQGVPKKIGFSEMRHFIYKLPKTCRIVLMIRKFKTSLLRTFKFIV